ncbi:hypothetical protein [Flavobacterium sp.]|uniref:hypothetical protein n=1 Tax=Flavobacterium sp. TaxID=239 RepID=UPI0035AF69A2
MTLKNSYELTFKKQNPNLNEVRVGYKSLAYYFPIQNVMQPLFMWGFETGSMNTQ